LRRLANPAFGDDELVFNEKSRPRLRERQNLSGINGMSKPARPGMNLAIFAAI
jgi:hypothetical protein